MEEGGEPPALWTPSVIEGGCSVIVDNLGTFRKIKSTPILFLAYFLFSAYFSVSVDRYIAFIVARNFPNINAPLYYF